MLYFLCFCSLQSTEMFFFHIKSSNLLQFIENEEKCSAVTEAIWCLTGP